MIKITKSTYGVKRLNAKSGPFTLAPEEEARLVALGVAEYVFASGNPAEIAANALKASGAVSDKGKEETPAKTAQKAAKTASETKGKAAKNK